MVPSVPSENPHERFLDRRALRFLNPLLMRQAQGRFSRHLPRVLATALGRHVKDEHVKEQDVAEGRLRCREGRVTVLIVPSRSSASSSGGKPQAQHTRAAAHAAREGRGAGC